jgi:acetyltransferase-like isoleucine patch superfamily enzyme
MNKKKIIPMLFYWRTFFVLIYIKCTQDVIGWKYNISNFSTFRCAPGSLALANKCWFSKNVVISTEDGNVDIGHNVFINRNVMIVSMERISIGDDVLIGNNVSIYDHDHVFKNRSVAYGKQGFITARVRIDDKVWIGANSVILKGVTIGYGSVIAAGSVVNKSIPSRQIWGGVPVKFIKNIEDSQ